MVRSLSVRYHSVLAALAMMLGLASPTSAHALESQPILCRYIEDKPSFASLDTIWRTYVLGRPRLLKDTDATECNQKATSATETRLGEAWAARKSVLVGPGDVVVVVEEARYAEVLEAAGGKPLRLFLNGFDLGGQGALISVQRGNSRVALRFRAGSRKEGAEKFWSSIYESHGLLGEAPLRAAVGWDTEPVFDSVPDKDDRLFVTVTERWALALATLLLFIFLVAFAVALRWSDIFRTAPLKPWWRDARALQTHIRRTVPGWSRKKTNAAPKVSSNDAIILQAVRMQTMYEDFEWPPSDKETIDAYCQRCKERAARALAGRQLDEEAVRMAVIGLGVYGASWKLPRLPYSLARVQSGLWLMFAITAAIYLWVVYGSLPALEGSVLGLVAISAATTGGSLLIDNGKASSSSPSQGFFRDILTDADDVQQAHRYQAIVVNGLLLVVGVTYVVQNLVYPTFDSSWLGLLSISGLAQTLGKQAIERDATEPKPSTNEDLPQPAVNKP